MRTLQLRLSLAMAAICILVIPIESFSQEIPHLYRGTRVLGMGGAYTAVSNDANGLFFNPAGLHGATTLFSLDVFNPQFEISEESASLYRDISDVEGDDVSDVVDLLQDHVGEHQHLRVSFFPHFLLRNWGVGILAQGTSDLEVRNPVFPEANTDIKLDLGLVAGGGFEVLDGVVVGLSGKFIQRKGINRNYNAVDIAGENFDPLDDLENEFDFALDLGGMIRLGDFLLPAKVLDPSIGIVIQDITKLDFDGLGETPTHLNLGAAIHPDFWIIESTVALDLMDITQAIGEDEDFNKRFHFGVELKFPMILSVRAGINQKFFTAGAAVDLWFFALEYATYAEEVGVFAGQRDDRRHVLMVRIGP